MADLKNEQQQIPGGYKFFEPGTRWTPAPFSSLDSITQQLISHRQGRPDLTAKLGWSLEFGQVRAEVKAYNVHLCIQNGWKDYITGDEQSVPFQARRSNPLNKARAVVGGADVIIHWIAEGSPTVAPELANKRAEICAGCPMNGQGGWEAYFTVPVSNAIRREMGRKSQMKLSTSMDEKLGVCEGCACPLPLKIWMPLARIIEKMPAEQKNALHEKCWITYDAP